MTTKRSKKIIDTITKEAPMADEGSIKGWGRDKDGVPVITETERKLSGKFKQSGYIPITEEAIKKEQDKLSGEVDELEEHFVAINNALERGHKFKMGQCHD